MVLGSGIGKNLFRIPDPGVKKAPDPGCGSATLAKFLRYIFISLLISILKSGLALKNPPKKTHPKKPF
jgi:hypothetical protein